MIEYDFLCQAINDWREGRRPSAPPPPSGGNSAIEEVDSDVVVIDETGGESYDASEYAEAEPADAGYGEGYGEGYEAAEGAPAEAYGGPVDQTQAYVPDEDSEGVEPSVDVDVDVDIEAEVERDYDLEATDDFASFDVTSELSRWFVARFRIEQAWEDAAQRSALFAEYGIRDGQHFYQVQATMDRYVQSEDAESRYGGLDAIMQLQVNTQQDYQRELMQGRAEGELAGELEPVEGIGLDEWAICQATIASGADVDDVIAELGIERDHWDRVSAEWNDRMSRDTTATIATEYGKAFAAAGAGSYGAAGADGAAAMEPGGDVEGASPIPLEQYVEIEQAQAIGAEQGRDAAEVLAGYGMSAVDWSNISAWWSQYLSRHMMENEQELYQRYAQLQEHYAAHFRGEG